jgi:tyrosyl-tRNA synthetase
MKTIIDILKERELFEDMTSPELEKRVESQVTVYAGFDPSSDSLQVGNLVTLMTLARFQKEGHNVIAVAGGATGMIGDPSGKSAERNLLSEEEVEKNLEGIKENLARILDFEDAKATAKIVNNNDWFKEFTFVEVLRDVGKHFRMGSMLGKESVKTRLNSEEGMSFAEFSYQLLQAYDFLKLFETEGCTVQLGGSDQWGNITAGTDLVRKLKSAEVYGITVPLVCDSNGVKFGKSEGNALYLDSRKTSVYDFYQFFVRTEDVDVVRYLKILTFLSMDEIAGLEASLKEAPEKREAQKKLAEEVTRIVHGEGGLQSAVKASAVLFGESMDGLAADDILGIFADAPSSELASGDVVGKSVIDVAVAAGLSKSKGEARRLIQNGGMNINNVRISDIAAEVSATDVIDGKLLVLRSGKKNYRLVRVV